MFVKNAQEENCGNERSEHNRGTLYFGDLVGVVSMLIKGSRRKISPRLKRSNLDSQQSFRARLYMPFIEDTAAKEERTKCVKQKLV